MHKVYRGDPGPVGGAATVHVGHCDGEGDDSFCYHTEPLEHHVLHSPTGFAWGYAGSGPAELARCLLWDHLGAEPDPAAYEAFKADRLAPLHPERRWSFTSLDLEQWCQVWRSSGAPLLRESHSGMAR